MLASTSVFVRNVESGSRFGSFGGGRNHDEPFPFRTMARSITAQRIESGFRV